MMRSLWAGVSGLQAHQMAMDVEGNNIANVNTTGYKYSRVNFADLLSQTSKIATAPQGDMGGKNAIQVGLGTKVNAVTKIFSQGSIQTTDKNTDLAIQGDGFFVLSGDSGRTYKYTRSGDFNFDAKGHLVDNNGYIVQGWVRDSQTGKIDSTTSVTDITIPPGLTAPANPSSYIALKANLNSGDTIISKSPIRPLDSVDGTAGADNVQGTRDDEKIDDFEVLFNEKGEAFNLQEGQGIKVSFDGGKTTKEFRYTNDSTKVDTTAASGVYRFKSTEDLRAALQHWAKQTENTVEVTVNERGKYVIDNSNQNAANDLNIVVSSIEDDNTVENVRFTNAFQSLSGELPAKSTVSRVSQIINAATYASSIDIYDSLGTKHTVRFEFRKSGYKRDENGTKVGTVWDMKVSVPEPGDIKGKVFPNEVDGQITFNKDGSLSSYTPTSITYTANNGSAPNQIIDLKFGSAGDFDGLTSFDSRSNTASITQDGYQSGDLIGISIDESGMVIGNFSNGRNMSLAKIAMARFTNNSGLQSEGSSLFTETANSGAALIGEAALGGRGFIQSSALEMSNVDLSRSLTQLIVVQRGFQANSKTITTSDQMLNTLLQLKQ